MSIPIRSMKPTEPRRVGDNGASVFESLSLLLLLVEPPPHGSSQQIRGPVGESLCNNNNNNNNKDHTILGSDYRYWGLKFGAEINRALTTRTP